MNKILKNIKLLRIKVGYLLNLVEATIKTI